MHKDKDEKLTLRKCIHSLRKSDIGDYKHLSFKHEGHNLVNESLVLFPQEVSICQLLSVQYPLRDSTYALGQLHSLQHPKFLISSARPQRSSLLSRHLGFFSWEIRANEEIGNIHVSSHYPVGTQLRGTSGYQNHKGNSHNIDTAVIVDVGGNINIF